MPMPSVYTELVRFRVGTQVATEAILAGKRYNQADALTAGFYDRVVDPKQLLERCREAAACVPHGSLPAFAHSKRMLLAPLLERIHSKSAQLDQATARAVSDPRLSKRQRLSMDELKHRRRKKG
jgi:enoyl-CoA hydratase/carnithine racemase